MRLAPELWDALAEICRHEGQDTNRLVRQIEDDGRAGGHTGGAGLRGEVLPRRRERGCPARGAQRRLE